QATARDAGGRRRSRRGQQRGSCTPRRSGRGRTMTGTGAGNGDRIDALLAGPRGIVNVGVAMFADILESRGIVVIHVDWQPPAGRGPEHYGAVPAAGGVR